MLETAGLDDNVYMSPSAGLRCQLAMRFFWLRHNVSFQVKKNDDYSLGPVRYNMTMTPLSSEAGVVTSIEC